LIISFLSTQITNAVATSSSAPLEGDLGETGGLYFSRCFHGGSSPHGTFLGGTPLLAPTELDHFYGVPPIACLEMGGALSAGFFIS